MTEQGRALRAVATAVAMMMALASCGGGGDAADRVARADDASEGGRFREAIILLRNTVGNEPNNAQARYELSSAALTLGDAATAQKELIRARELGFDTQATIPLMAESLLLLGQGDEALAELALAEKQTAQVLGLRGLAHEARGEGELALDAYQAALAIDPMEERALLGTGRSYLMKQDRELAAKAFEAVVAAHGDSPTVRLEYGRYLYGLGRASDAQGQFEWALAQPLAQEHLPLRWELSLALAEAQLAQGELLGAEQTIDSLNELQPDHMLVKYLRARSAFERKELALANDLVERVLVEAPDFGAGQILQATIYLARSEYAQAAVLLERLAVLQPNDAQVRKLLAAAISGADPQGRGAANPRELTDQEVLTLLGSANAKTGDYQAAVMLWERVLRDDPKDEQTRLELATAHALRGDVGAAQAQLVDATWTTPANEERAAVLDTVLSLVLGDIAAARGKALAASTAFPQSAQVVSLQGVVALREDAAGTATGFFQRALALDPAHTASVINLSNIAAASGDAGRASALLRDFLDAYPGDARALEALALVQRRAGDVPGARASLEQARSADPNAVSPRFTLVDLLALSGDYARAEKVAREIVALRPADPSAHNALGVSLVGLGKLEEGIASLRTALRLDSSALEPLRNLARAEYASTQLIQARQSIDQLLRVRPNDTVGLDLAIRLAIDEGRIDDAQALFRRLDEPSPGSDGAPPLLKRVLAGDIALARGQYADALREYEAVFAQRQSTTMVMRLYRARVRRGEENPQRVLRTWLEQYPDDRTVRLAAAMYAQGGGDLVTATSDYEYLLRLDRRDPVLWNNLAWAYSDQGDFRALEASRRAMELASTSPTIQDTYGWMLVLDNQLDNGISILRDAWEAAPTTGEIGYHLAAGLARAGQEGEAREVLQQALAQGGQFSAREAAEQLMSEL